MTDAFQIVRDTTCLKLYVRILAETCGLSPAPGPGASLGFAFDVVRQPAAVKVARDASAEIRCQF